MSGLNSDTFPTTHWSQVGRAGVCDTGVRDEALRRLLEQYIRPMQVHLRARAGLDAEAAEELVQQFLVSKVLGRQFLNKAAAEKGRFRTYLLTALDRCAINSARDRRRARGESLESIPEPLDPAPAADVAFDAAWAREVLGHAMRRMREECLLGGRNDVWSIFESRVVAPAFQGDAPVPYDVLVKQLQLDSPAEGFNLLATAKRSFARALRAVVGEYEKDSDQIDQEIADLRAALSRRR